MVSPRPRRSDSLRKKPARRVKALARTLGADLVRTGPLNPEWVYSHVARTYGNAEGFARWGDAVDLCHHTNAMSMGFRMDPDLNRTAPEFPTLSRPGSPTPSEPVPP